MIIKFDNKTYDLTNPDYPYSFEQNVVSDDVESINGHVYSRIKFKRRKAQLNFSNIPSYEIDSWIDLYDKTNGFRTPFLFADPLTGTEFSVVSSGDFPFKLESLDSWAGSITLIEVKN